MATISSFIDTEASEAAQAMKSRHDIRACRAGLDSAPCIPYRTTSTACTLTKWIKCMQLVSLGQYWLLSPPRLEVRLPKDD